MKFGDEHESISGWESPLPTDPTLSATVVGDQYIFFFPVLWLRIFDLNLIFMDDRLTSI